MMVELDSEYTEYARGLATWDRRIIEIVAIAGIAEADKLNLVCTFEPEPPGDIVGYFWIANLLVRDEYELLSQQQKLPQQADLGFRIGEAVFLAGGEILRELGEHTVLWPQEVDQP
jgi:hypothetical protein